MTGTIRYLSKMNLSLLTSNITRQLIFNGGRTIYTEPSLGLTDYRKSRQTFSDKYRLGADAFREKMKNIVASETEMVFTEDLKAILHLVEKTPDEVELVKKCIEKFNTQSAEMRFGSFKFGPVVMRTFHYLNEPKVAKELFLNPKLDGFFDQVTTFMILLDLLYENGEYTTVCEVYDIISKKFVAGVNHPKLAINVVALACYKLNTPESLEHALAISKDLQERGSTLVRKFAAILGALALNQNKPELAIEIVSRCHSPDYVSTRSIKVAALADLGRIDDILSEFHHSLRRGIPLRNQYYPDTIQKVIDATERLGIGEDAEIHRLINIFKTSGYIFSLTLDAHTLQPIEALKRVFPREDRYQDDGWSNRRSPAFRGDARNQRFRQGFDFGRIENQ